MLTLDLLGKLDRYSNVFDIDSFKENRPQYIGKLISKRKQLTLDRELLSFIKQKGIPAKAYLYSFPNYFTELKNDLKKKVQRW